MTSLISGYSDSHQCLSHLNAVTGKAHTMTCHHAGASQSFPTWKGNLTNERVENPPAHTTSVLLEGSFSQSFSRSSHSLPLVLNHLGIQDSFEVSQVKTLCPHADHIYL